MPLEDGYGVIIGTLHDYFRDPVNDFGQYYHANAMVRTPAGTYHCAIDVDSKGLPNGVEWRLVEIRESDLHGLGALPHGWHSLPSNAESGALDYVRSPEFRPEPGDFFELSDTVVEALRGLPQAATYAPWKQGTSRDALADLEPLLEDPKALYVFGEPFAHGLGVHNIHENQGEPSDSQWWAENGIWQDGATLTQRQDDTLVAFLNKFKTQSYVTDQEGHRV